MAARTKSLILVGLVTCGASLIAGAPSSVRDGVASVPRAPEGFAPRAQTLSTGERPVTRIISLVPAMTEMLFAIGAGPQVVAVSSYEDYPAEATRLPRVGALLDPDVERILALRPDLVLTYGSQDTLQAQLTRAGIRTYNYRHGGLDTLLKTVVELGAATGHDADAARTAHDIRRHLDMVAARVRGRPRPRVLLVFGRERQSLRQLYVSGGVGFLHEMLSIAGGTNVFADIRRESVQPSSEMLLTRAPDVILEMHETRTIAGAEAERERAPWSALASIPAVRNGRIHFLNGDYLMVPGPRVGLATEAFARALHPEAFR
jgi:iron complex transport system substrate-binding protein